ncbi:MAG: glycosyltransferase family protein [Actinomycetota bacterium]
MSVRIVLYSHDSVGLGHIRRNLALAHALSEGLPGISGESVTGLLVAGRPEATEFPVPEGWDWLILPGVERSRGGYASRALDIDLSSATAMRGEVFRSAVLAFDPDLVIVDRHPLGVGRELESALRTLRVVRPQCRIVLGLRDVLDAPEVAAAEWAAVGGSSVLRSLLDAVWVYGDPRIHDLAANGELPGGLRDLVAHTGYLSTGRTIGADFRIDDPFVLTTVGGGSDGAALAEAAAAATVPEGFRHLVVAGPQMPDEDRRRVRRAAGPRTRVVRRVPDMLPLLHRAAAVVCMGGYNTVCELMSTDTPALVVPRVERRAEQRMRVAALVAVGAVESSGPAEASAERIGDWFASTAGTSVSRASIALDGLASVPGLAAALLAGAAAEAGDLVAV